MTHTTKPNCSYEITLGNLCCVAFAPSLLALKRTNTRLIRDTVKSRTLTIPHPCNYSHQITVGNLCFVAFTLSLLALDPPYKRTSIFIARSSLTLAQQIGEERHHIPPLFSSVSLALRKAFACLKSSHSFAVLIQLVEKRASPLTPVFLWKMVFHISRNSLRGNLRSLRLRVFHVCRQAQVLLECHYQQLK